MLQLPQNSIDQFGAAVLQGFEQVAATQGRVMDEEDVGAVCSLHRIEDSLVFFVICYGLGILVLGFLGSTAAGECQRREASKAEPPWLLLLQDKGAQDGDRSERWPQRRMISSATLGMSGATMSGTGSPGARRAALPGKVTRAPAHPAT